MQVFLLSISRLHGCNGSKILPLYKFGWGRDTGDTHRSRDVFPELKFWGTIKLCRESVAGVGLDAYYVVFRASVHVLYSSSFIT